MSLSSSDTFQLDLSWGFTPGAATYRIIDLGDISGGADYSNPTAVNNCGHVVGESGATGGQRGFLWRNGTMTDLGSLPDGTSTDMFAEAHPDRQPDAE